MPLLLTKASSSIKCLLFGVVCATATLAQANPAELQSYLSKRLASQPWSGQLPTKVNMGAATIHRYQEPKVAPPLIAVTVWVPMAWQGGPSLLENLNATTLPRDLKNKWIIGDGGTTRAFVGVDLSPGSALEQAIDYLLKKAMEGTEALSPAERRESILRFAAMKTGDYVRWTEGATFNDGRQELPWDIAIGSVGDLSVPFKTAAPLPIFHYPVDSGVQFPVVGLERYLAIGKGYCLHKALVASLLLSRAGIEHRLVNGAVSLSPGVSTGHTWIELPEGRVLDVAWNLLETPKKGHPDHSDWIFVGSKWRFQNENYLVLSL